MLVLSRKSEQSIVIGEDVVISFLRVKGNRVTVGIDAPSSVIVKRAELLFDSDGSSLERDSNTRQLRKIAK